MIPGSVEVAYDEAIRGSGVRELQQPFFIFYENQY
jgi:hypothetical protein